MDPVRPPGIGSWILVTGRLAFIWHSAERVLIHSHEREQPRTTALGARPRCVSGRASGHDLRMEVPPARPGWLQGGPSPPLSAD